MQTKKTETFIDLGFTKSEWDQRTPPDHIIYFQTGYGHKFTKRSYSFIQSKNRKDGFYIQIHDDDLDLLNRSIHIYGKEIKAMIIEMKKLGWLDFLEDER